MDENIFITDNRLNFSRLLAEHFTDKNMRICITSNEPNTSEETKKKKEITELYWNRNSLFSLQTLPLQLKNLEIKINTAFIIFDTPAYFELYPYNLITDIDAITADLIASNMALIEVLKKYFVKKGVGKFIFIHRDMPISYSNPGIAAASGAFVRMAEESVFSIAKEEKPSIQTLLVKLEGNENEIYTEWLLSQLALPVLSRTPGRWIKAGSRGFFGK